MLLPSERCNTRHICCNGLHRLQLPTPLRANMASRSRSMLTAASEEGLLALSRPPANFLDLRRKTVELQTLRPPIQRTIFGHLRTSLVGELFGQLSLTNLPCFRRFGDHVVFFGRALLPQNTETSTSTTAKTCCRAQEISCQLRA